MLSLQYEDQRPSSFSASICQIPINDRIRDQRMAPPRFISRFPWLISPPHGDSMLIALGVVLVERVTNGLISISLVTKSQPSLAGRNKKSGGQSSRWG